MLMTSLPQWQPPSEIPAIKTIDAHTGGEPFRIIVDGFPPVEGDTILERREYAYNRRSRVYPGPG